VILHGLTRTGRAHPGLLRFSRALAAAGHAVLVPEIVDWRELKVHPAVAVPLIREAIRALDEEAVSEPGGVGLMGFSFGATQGLIAAADPQTRRHLRGVAAWGGYRDVHRLFHFGLTGRHELDGRHWAVPPDPYGGWVMGSNYLTRIPGYEDRHAAAEALRRLAVEAGDSKVYAGSPAFDPVKVKHAVGLDGKDREVYDVFAPPSTAWSAAEDRSPAARALARDLADAALAAEPLLEPGAALPALDVPTIIAHGRDDRLVPFTEAVRLAREMPARTIRRVTVTELFQHSGGTTQGLGPVGLAREGTRFLGLLGAILRLTDAA
jgi:pimeloyl-ACP methyl ester carboxylesterase